MGDGCNHTTHAIAIVRFITISFGSWHPFQTELQWAMVQTLYARNEIAGSGLGVGPCRVACIETCTAAAARIAKHLWSSGCDVRLAR